MDRLTNARHWVPWVYFAIVIVAALSSASLYVRQRNANHQIKHLVAENQDRISDNRILILRIQRSRVTSCEKTWVRITKILEKSRGSRPSSPARDRIFQQILNLADPHQCIQQTKPPKNPSP